VSRTGWKAFERYVAAIFGTTRLGPVGKNGPDLVTDLFSVECRERAAITFTNVEDWAAEVRRESDGRVPVLALRRCRGRGHKAAPVLFVLDEKAWRDLHQASR
jgi:hypothetical protein